MEADLDRLEQSGVLEKVKWAAPIVAVLKKDNKVRICGDYKVTVNPVLDVNQYPLSHTLLTCLPPLQVERALPKLDLTHAYNQMLLDEDSRKYVTINTHRSLYQYTRLPFGIASAPALFSNTRDTILQGLDRMICYIDDYYGHGSQPGRTPEEFGRGP